jgi:hypothetical protein
MVINITASKHDAYLSKIMSEYSKLLSNMNEKSTKHDKEVESYNKVVEEYEKFVEDYNKKVARYENASDSDKNKNKMLKEIDDLKIKEDSYYKPFLENKPLPYVENNNKILYFENVIKLINNFKKAIVEPKNLNTYFIELLIILDSKNITYKNRLIFLDEFQKHLDDEKIIMGIIDALEQRQNLIKKYNMLFDIKEQNLDIDMDLSVYIHKKNKDKTISDIYNSLLNNFIYKYNVYSYSEYVKSKLNDDPSFKDNCNKYQIYYAMLKSLDNYNGDKLDDFESEVITNENSSDLT